MDLELKLELNLKSEPAIVVPYIQRYHVESEPNENKCIGVIEICAAILFDRTGKAGLTAHG